MRSKTTGRARPKADDDALTVERRALASRIRDIEGDRVRLATRAGDLSRRNAGLVAEADVPKARIDGDVAVRRRAVGVTDRMSDRARHAAIRNVSEMGVEAVPSLGAAAIVGLTFLEVRDARAGMRDMRELSDMTNGTGAADPPLCGCAPAALWAALRGARANWIAGPSPR